MRYLFALLLPLTGAASCLPEDPPETCTEVIIAPEVLANGSYDYDGATNTWTHTRNDGEVEVIGYSVEEDSTIWEEEDCMNRY